MNREKLSSTIIIVALFGILTFLFIKTKENDVERHHEVIFTIQHLSHQDSLLNESILEFRADRFSNYDSITKQKQIIIHHLNWFKSPDSELYGSLGNDMDSAIDRAADQFKSKLELIERFKSHNGILKNSVYYLPTAIEHNQLDLGNGIYHADMNHLLREILLFNSRPNEKNKSKAYLYIEELKSSQLPNLTEISLHAETVISQRIKLQKTIDQLFDVPTMQSIDAIYQIYSRYTAEKTKLASTYRTAMYIMALLLTLYVLHLFLMLRRTMYHLEDSLNEVEFQKNALDKHAIVASISADGIVNYVNDKYVEISQYSKDDVVGQYWGILDTDNAGYFNEMLENLSTEQRWTGEVKNERKDGSHYWVDATIVPFLDKANKPIRYVALLNDITDRKNNEARVHHLAHYDGLTQLPNRAFFLDRLNSSLDNARRTNNKLAVLFLDLDNFKMINDTMGHASGDELLKIVATHLRSSVREADTVSRLGGDEFTILLDNIQYPDDIDNVIQRIMSITQKTATIGKSEITISTSIGISVFPNDADDVDSLLKNADIAMYQAKADGKNAYQYFSEELKLTIMDRHCIEKELRCALQEQQFELYYQPQVVTETGEICALEALIRWNHPEKGLIPPDSFIPILEDTGLIIDVGKWVLLTAHDQLVELKKLGFNLRMAANISAQQLRDFHLVEYINELLKRKQVEPEELELELTESSILQNKHSSIAVLAALSDLGIGLSLDDFGTGYSSLSYLKKLPINILKIDRSFISDLPHDQHDMAIATTILAMAKNLDLKVVAEGVETAEQSLFLNDNGCDYLQGFFFSKPVKAEELQQLLAENRAHCLSNGIDRVA